MLNHHTTEIAPFTITGSMQSIDHSFDWGVRGGIGFNSEHDKWNGFLQYTYFSTKGTKLASVEFGKGELEPSLELQIYIMVRSLVYMQIPEIN